MSKTLVAYFSRKGNNYVAGSIVNLEIGNTAVIAGYLTEALNADTFEIEAAHTYPKDYHDCTKVAKTEKQNQERPALTATLKSLEAYDTVYLGFPNWWNTLPMPVFTFLEHHDFAGKTIIPFCTHEGSGIGNSVTDIKKACPGATVKDGIAIWGHAVNNQKNNIITWLEGAN